MLGRRKTQRRAATNLKLNKKSHKVAQKQRSTGRDGTGVTMLVGWLVINKFDMVEIKKILIRAGT